MKNKVLLYQESKVMPLLRNEKLLFRNHDKVVDYIQSNLGEMNLGESQEDEQFAHVISLKVHSSREIKDSYEHFNRIVRNQFIDSN